MNRAIAIARREMGSYFRLPAGWIITALYLLLSGIVFSIGTLAPGQPATLKDFFGVSGWLLLPVAPAISMRLIAEELRSGTIESLMTAPVGSASLVVGKFLGALGFLAAMLLPTLAYVAVLYMLAEPAPDAGPMIAGYLMLVLLGGFYLAIGTLASALTNNATLAFMLTLFTILALLFAGFAAGFVPGAVRPLLYAVAINTRISDFARGVIDTAHIVFFITGAAWLLTVAVAAVEFRRWK